MKIYFFLFGLVCICQWYVPVSMIAGQEDILRNGQVYHFKTAPVDPSDPFRGKYIVLDFEAEAFKNTTGRQWDRNAEVFAILEEDSDGFAAIANITEERPGTDVDYFAAEVRFADDEVVRLRFPFERFYLEESKAADAEEIYAESTREDAAEADAYAVVRIKEGETALQDVMLDGKSVVELVRERNREVEAD